MASHTRSIRFGFTQKVGVHFVRGSGRRENSPAIYRWGSIGQSIQSAKRTAESQVRVSITAEISETLSFSRPFHGLICKSRFDPSTKVLGYSHSVRFADDTNSVFWAKLRKVVQSSSAAAIIPGLSLPETFRNLCKEHVHDNPMSRETFPFRFRDHICSPSGHRTCAGSGQKNSNGAPYRPRG